MAESERVELTLLGQTLSLRTEAEPDYLRALAAFVEERVASLQAHTRTRLRTSVSLPAPVGTAGVGALDSLVVEKRPHPAVGRTGR